MGPNEGAGDNRILRLGLAVAFLFAHGSSVGVSAFSFGGTTRIGDY